MASNINQQGLLYQLIFLFVLWGINIFFVSDPSH